jgi:hypothetical protein
MNTDKLTAEVNELLDRRNQLLQKRDATQDPNEAEVLSESIARTDTELPALRKRVHDTLNATKDHSERKRLKKLERRIDRVLSGVEIERESDISMRYEEELHQALRQAKTNSERLRINKKLRQLLRDRNLFFAHSNLPEAQVWLSMARLDARDFTCVRVVGLLQVK